MIHSYEIMKIFSEKNRRLHLHASEIHITYVEGYDIHEYTGIHSEINRLEWDINVRKNLLYIVSVN